MCPFNKPNNSWLHRMIRGMIEGRMVSADKVMVKLDQASGYGKQTEDTEFWKLDGLQEHHGPGEDVSRGG